MTSRLSTSIMPCRSNSSMVSVPLSAVHSFSNFDQLQLLRHDVIDVDVVVSRFVEVDCNADQSLTNSGEAFGLEWSIAAIIQVCSMPPSQIEKQAQL